MEIEEIKLTDNLLDFVIKESGFLKKELILEAEAKKAPTNLSNDYYDTGRADYTYKVLDKPVNIDGHEVVGYFIMDRYAYSRAANTPICYVVHVYIKN